MEHYRNGNENFDRIFENSLNGVDPNDLSEKEIEIQEKWIDENWEDLTENS